MSWTTERGIGHAKSALPALVLLASSAFVRCKFDEFKQHYYTVFEFFRRLYFSSKVRISKVNNLNVRSPFYCCQLQCWPKHQVRRCVFITRALHAICSLTHGASFSCSYALCILNILQSWNITCLAYCILADGSLAFGLSFRPRCSILRGCTFAYCVVAFFTCLPRIASCRFACYMFAFCTFANLLAANWMMQIECCV